MRTRLAKPEKAQRYERGLAWYAEHFRGAGPDQLAGEKTPNYLFLPENPNVPGGHRRIVEALPEVRMVAVLRDPVERAVSAVNHVLPDGLVSPLYHIDDLFGKHIDRVPWRVLEFGLYARQLSAFFDLFGRDRILVLYYEDDVVARPGPGVEAACEFLGLEPQISTAALERRPNSGRRSWLRLAVDRHLPALRRWTPRLDRWLPSFYASPSEDVRRRLYEYYARHNEELFDMLGRRPETGWRPPAASDGAERV